MSTSPWEPKEFRRTRLPDVRQAARGVPHPGAPAGDRPEGGPGRRQGSVGQEDGGGGGVEAKTMTMHIRDYGHGTNAI